MEATLHASDSIGNLVSGKLNVPDGIADSLTVLKYGGWEELKAYLNHYASKYHFVRMSIDQFDGSARASDGTFFDATDEEGFRKAIQGISNISEPFSDKVSGKEIITFNSPIKDSGNIIGALSVSQYTQDLHKYLAVSFFNGEGYSLIMDQSGQIIVRSSHPNADESISNVF